MKQEEIKELLAALLVECITKDDPDVLYHGVEDLLKKMSEEKCEISAK